MKQKIMIIEDNMITARQVSAFLSNDGYETKVYLDGESALADFQSYLPHLVLLDYFLPGMNAPDVCAGLRKLSLTPIIVLSANTRTQDKIQMLELGADDYIIKPFDSKEMVARVKAVLRRYTPAPAPAAPQPEPPKDTESISYTDLSISLSNYSVIYMGKPIEMPPKEMELLYFLASHPNQVFTREQLLDQIWGYEYIGETRTVDVHIKRLREKIKDHAEWALSTVWGIGYKFEMIPERF